MSKIVNKKTLAKQELWRRGNLFWKCHPVQREMHTAFYEAEPNSINVWLLSRQSGKSFLLAILALEQSLKKPNSVTKLLTDTKIHIKSIFEPIFNILLEDCPEDLKPVHHRADHSYVFANGSQIQLAGSDGGSYERLRGQRSELILVDEAGFCSHLEEIVKSVLLPTTTHTGGKIVLASTPSAEPDHEFHDFIEEAELNGTLTVKTIYDNPLLTKDQIERIKMQMGGEKSSKFQREYLCRLARGEDLVLFPELTPELEQKIVREWPRPALCNTYVGMDLGFTDLTAVVFAYYDFRANKIVIEDEYVINGPEMSIPKLSDIILKKEEELWTHPLTQEINSPLVRVSDLNPIVLNELRIHSNGKLNFKGARKDDKEAAIHDLRVMIANEHIIIHPRCKNTIRHLKNVRWSKSQTKKTFARSPDNGHYDLVDAIQYMVREIDKNKNPYPNGWGMDRSNTFSTKSKTFSGMSTPEEALNKIFNIQKTNSADSLKRTLEILNPKRK